MQPGKGRHKNRICPLESFGSPWGDYLQRLHLPRLLGLAHVLPLHCAEQQLSCVSSSSEGAVTSGEHHC